MVIRSSSIIPEMRSAYFSCTTCGFHVQVEIDRGRISEPMVCALCNVTHSFELIHNRSFFADKRLVKLQETSGKKRTEINLHFLFNVIRRNASGSNTRDSDSDRT